MTLPAPDRQSRVVITGASSGIGEALATGLAARGHSLILVARRMDRLEALADRLHTTHGVEVELRPCDLADRSARAELAAEVAKREIAALCNNAGFATFGQVRHLDPAREAEEVEVNAVAVQGLTLAALPGMAERRAGAILIVGSTAGHQPIPGGATYSATKAFANTFAEALHTELRGTGVSCTLLAPGPVRTEFTKVAEISVTGLAPSFAWVSAERAANEAIAGMERGARIVVPGWFAKVQTVGGRHTPRAALLRLLSSLTRRLSG